MSQHNNDDSIKNINTAFSESLNEPKIGDLGIDVVEILIDDLFKNVVLQEIPIIKTLSASYSVYTKIKIGYWAKKIVCFLQGFQSFSLEERNKWCNEIKSDSKKVESLLIILDRLDQYAKVKALVKLLEARLKEEITEQDFSRYKYALDKIDYGNIELLTNVYRYSTVRNDLRNKLELSTSEQEKLQIKEELTNILEQRNADIASEESTSFLSAFANVGLLKTEVGYIDYINHPYFPNNFGRKFLEILGHLPKTNTSP